MIEVRIHGRGGQGIVTTSELLAVAAFNDGKFSQAFPKFGPERSGSPVESYCRIDTKPIEIRSQIYEPDFLVVMDSSLFDVINVSSGLKPEGVIIMNSKNNIQIKPFRTVSIDATSIATEIFDRPIVNTIMLGAFAKISGCISMESIEKALNERFSNAKKNIEAVRRAYNECKT
ncbi:MAG: pyruvate ferredoxin oxidoreductase subunit gamma [Candidatus Aenigmatarchaeota archaeon]